MNTVKYDGKNFAAVVAEFKDLNYQSRADGKKFIFDAKSREWVELKSGDTIVDSPDGYYVGDKKGNPSHDVADGPVLASVAESTPEDTYDDGVVTSDDVAKK
jgi:hypothetical protein